MNNDFIIETMIHEMFMEKAIKQARNVKEGEFPVGCVVVYGDKIISKGKACDRTSCDPTAHAEVVAIRKACLILKRNTLRGCSIYTTAEPCPMCMSLILQTKIDDIVFGAYRENLPFRKRFLKTEDFVADSGYDLNVIGGILEEEILKLFLGKKEKKYFSKIDFKKLFFFKNNILEKSLN